jgi:DNA modification methylase
MERRASALPPPTMKTIPLTSIKIPPNRQRRAFDPAKLHALGESLQTHGLLHPVVLRTLDGELFLVAGERRMRAAADLAALGQAFLCDGQPVPPGEIPYTLLPELPPLEAEEAELEENTQREDLTWQERAAAVARLNSLRGRQAVARGDKPPGITEITEEISGRSSGYYRDKTRKEILLAAHLDKPEVKAAKSLDDAFKLLQRQEQAERSRALGESVGRTYTADVHRVFMSDALAWLSTCGDQEFDVVLTDPPYGVGADEFGDAGGRAAGAHEYADAPELLARILAVCPAELFRVTKPQAHLYWFCDVSWFARIKDAFEAAGWWCFSKPLIWHNPRGQRAPWPEHGPRRQYETCFYAVKGKRPVLHLAPDVLIYPPDENLGHSAQKPVALFEDLLRRSAMPGDVVLDPFCGSGPIFPAAHALKCRATGVEMSQTSYGISVKRIEALSAQGEIVI